MASVDVVQSGDAWAFPLPPCSRAMIPRLERNEALVTWVQASLSDPSHFRVGVPLWRASDRLIVACGSRRGGGLWISSRWSAWMASVTP
jgi:hypothetical protein